MKKRADSFVLVEALTALTAVSLFVYWVAMSGQQITQKRQEADRAIVNAEAEVQEGYRQWDASVHSH